MTVSIRGQAGASGVAVQQADVRFDHIVLDPPFVIAKATLSGFTLATVDVTVESAAGRFSGRGASVLSVAWAWPEHSLTFEERDAVLRQLVTALAAQATSLEAGDPFQLWSQLNAQIPGLLAAQPLKPPALAIGLALAALDNAIHDAWGKSLGAPVSQLYTADYLASDLSSILGSEFRGRYPGDYYATPRRRIPVQHVVSPTDPLVTSDGNKRSLTEWLSDEQIEYVKLKVMGVDPEVDAERIAAIYQACTSVGVSPHLAVDPNEAHPNAEATASLLDRLEAKHPTAFAALRYLEQPWPRQQIDPASITEVSNRVPILADEELGSLDDLLALPDSGWSGAVIKASKGQTYSLLTQAVARQSGLLTAVQDLTAVDSALAHSARLASTLFLSFPQLEYNSRQYAVPANARLRTLRPELVDVQGGTIDTGDPVPGIY